MRPIRFCDLQPGDYFMAPWDAELLRMIKNVTGPVVNPDAPRGVELEVEYVATGKGLRTKSKIVRQSFNAELLCNYLRPGERDVELARINLTRG